MRSHLIAIALALLLAVHSTQVVAKSSAMMGEDHFVEWDPHILTLSPGEEGDIVVTVHGNREDTTMIGIRWNPIDGPGGPEGTVTPHYFELGSHEERDVTVHVRSRAVRGVGECSSDVRLTFFWGPNLTWSEASGFDRDTAEGWENLQIHVTDLFPEGTGDGDDGNLLPVVVVVILVAVIAVLVTLLVRRSG